MYVLFPYLRSSSNDKKKPKNLIQYKWSVLAHFFTSSINKPLLRYIFQTLSLILFLFVCLVVKTTNCLFVRWSVWLFVCFSVSPFPFLRFSFLLLCTVFLCLLLIYIWTNISLNSVPAGSRTTTDIRLRVESKSSTWSRE